MKHNLFIVSLMLNCVLAVFAWALFTGLIIPGATLSVTEEALPSQVRELPSPFKARPNNKIDIIATGQQ